VIAHSVKSAGIYLNVRASSRDDAENAENVPYALMPTLAVPAARPWSRRHAGSVVTALKMTALRVRTVSAVKIVWNARGVWMKQSSRVAKVAALISTAISAFTKGLNAMVSS